MNMLDTRDLYKIQCELQEELNDLKEAESDARNAYLEATEDEDHMEYCDCDICEELREAEKSYREWLEEYGAQLDELDDLESEISEWRHGETMIAVDDFPEYAEELAGDIGAIDRNANWPLNHIDWDAAADELSQNYTVVTYEGEDYYVRAV